MSSVPRRRRYYEGATTSHPASRSLLVRDRVPRGPPRFVLAEALPGGWRSRRDERFQSALTSSSFPGLTLSQARYTADRAHELELEKVSAQYELGFIQAAGILNGASATVFLSFLGSTIDKLYQRQNWWRQRVFRFPDAPTSDSLGGWLRP